MLDLKAQLLQAGLVTEKDVEKVRAEEEAEREKKRKAREAKKAAQQARAGGGKKGRGPGGKGRGAKRAGTKGGARGVKRRGPPKSPASDAEIWARRVDKLAAEGRSEQYAAIRSWVEKTRLDKEGGLPSEQAERFHFEKGDGAISWLTVEPDLAAKLKAGEAGIIAYIGFNGQLFAAVPREVALDVHKVRPEFLRILNGHTFELAPIISGKDRRKKERALAEANAPKAEGATDAADAGSDVSVDAKSAPAADAANADTSAAAAAATDDPKPEPSAPPAETKADVAQSVTQTAAPSSDTTQAADDPSARTQ